MQLLKNLCFLIPSTTDIADIKEFIKNYLMLNNIHDVQCVDDFIINFYYDRCFGPHEDDDLKIRILNNINDKSCRSIKHCLIILSDYKIAINLKENYEIFTHIPTQEYFNNNIECEKLKQQCQKITRIKKKLHTPVHYATAHYNSFKNYTYLDELIELIKNDLDYFLIRLSK